MLPEQRRTQCALLLEEIVPDKVFVPFPLKMGHPNFDFWPGTNRYYRKAMAARGGGPLGSVLS